MSTIDVYDDHIRFLGYHVPLDTSGLPPSTRDALIGEIQSGVDRPASATDEEIAVAEEDAREREREAILGGVEPFLEEVERALTFGDPERLKTAVVKLRDKVDALEWG